jgi:hypothetical protein
MLDEMTEKIRVFGGSFDGFGPAGVTAVFGLDGGIPAGRHVLSGSADSDDFDRG